MTKKVTDWVHICRQVLPFVIFCYFSNTSIISQQRCGTDAVYSSYDLDQLKSITTPRNSLFEIPVVFHVITLNGETPLSVLTIQEQIDILNDHYNESISPEAIYEEARPFIANPMISFCLATIDPDGNSTDGIIYHDTNDPNLGDRENIINGDRAVKNKELGGVDSWNTKRYLNIWAAPRDDGILGDSSLPLNFENESEDGIVINNRFVGFSDVMRSFGQGKTLVHEVGHYLGLLHPWGLDNICSNDDGVDDTPPQEGPYFGCPILALSSCGARDFINNFMDFSDDECLLFFTQGQVDLMHSILISSRSELIDNGCSRSEGNTAFDNILAYDSGDFLIIRDEGFRLLNMEVQLYDISGRKIYDIEAVDDIIFRVGIQNLRSGIYIIHLENESTHVARKVYISQL